MGQRLDAAARISARTVRAASKTPIAKQLRENLSFFRRVAAAAITEAAHTPEASPTTEATSDPPVGDPHPGLGRQPVGDFVPGDDEHCTCSAPAWCGATRGDVVHDLMTYGMRLDRSQAEAIWRQAQAARA